MPSFRKLKTFQLNTARRYFNLYLLLRINLDDAFLYTYPNSELSQLFIALKVGILPLTDDTFDLNLV